MIVHAPLGARLVVTGILVASHWWLREPHR